MRRAACLLLAGTCAAVEARAGDQIYYRKDDNGAIVLTNVPDHRDLRAYAGRPIPVGGSGEEFRDLIVRTALTHGLQPELVYAVVAVESNFNPRAVSNKGALGLMQLMPDTATRFGVADPFDPAENVVGGVRFLRYLLDTFGGDARLALAAYNAGETVVRANRAVPPYQETRSYVGKVLKLFGAGRKPYANREARRTAAGTRGPGPGIYSYTDDAGVVHLSDDPPPSRVRPQDGPASPAH